MLVSFSGIDGSGKSTQIAELCTELVKGGRSIELRTFWNDIASFKGLREFAGYKLFGGDVGVGTPQAPIRRRDKDVQTGFMTFVRLAVYLVDAISMRLATRKALNSEADVVIFDRCIYDQLVNLNMKSRFVRFYVQSILKLVPSPHVALFLDADPIAALARKPEYSLEFLRVNRDAYLAFARIAPGVTVIPPLTAEQVRTTVAKCIAAQFAGRTVQLGHAQPAAAGKDVLL